MKQILLLTTIMVLFNGCKENPKPPQPCKPQKCLYPKLPTYKEPEAKKFTQNSIREEPDGRISLIKTEFDNVLGNNIKLRKICRDYAYVNSNINKEYQK